MRRKNRATVAAKMRKFPALVPKLADDAALFRPTAQRHLMMGRRIPNGMRVAAQGVFSALARLPVWSFEIW
jgi:hypothetical protein